MEQSTSKASFGIRHAPTCIMKTSFTSFHKTITGSLATQNIAILAYNLYYYQGCPENSALDNWVEAERQLKHNLFSDSPQRQTNSDPELN